MALPASGSIRRGEDTHMAGRPHYPDTGEETEADADRKRLTARQRWTRVGVIMLVAVASLLMIILHLAGVVGPGSNG
jgi:hypothetical protein